MATSPVPILARTVAAVTLAGAAGCGGETSTAPTPTPELSCSIPTGQVFNGQVKDGIPALSDPVLVAVGAPELNFLLDTDRVISVEVGGTVLAVPLNILWYHEIVNVSLGGRQLALTHCPLTGSSLAFDRAAVGGAEFGVSGLLYQNNLMMYDRSTDQSLWPQMLRGARCGSKDGVQLDMYPIVEMTWGVWKALHPDGRAVGANTGFDRAYVVFPYGDYDRIDNPELLFPMPAIDGRRSPKERTLGIPDGEGGGVGYPFLQLQERGDVAAVHDGDRVVFWHRRAQAAMAYERAIDGQALTFDEVDGAVVDVETGSTWSVEGRALDGPLAGERLQPVAEAYVSYWFAWAAFQPRATLWDGR